MEVVTAHSDSHHRRIVRLRLRLQLQLKYDIQGYIYIQDDVGVVVAA